MVILLLAHAASTWVLTGLVWVVQVVVYPGFLLAGGAPGWPRFHASHSARMARVVLLPWAVQGGTLAALLLTRPVPLWLLAAASACALATVGVTAGVSVPLHRRLAAYDEQAARALVRTNWWRTAAWTGSGLCSAAMLALH